MKSGLAIILCYSSILFAGCSSSKQDETVSPKAQPNESSAFWAHHYNTITDVPYGSHSDQRVDIYTYGSYVGEPSWFQRSSDRKPTFVWFHGGGWRFGNKETDAWFFMHFMERGWNVVNVEYRKGLSTAPDAAEDALLVMKWIRDNAEEYRFDTNRIVVSGASAGGHLALLAGLVNSVAGSHPSYVGDDMRIQAIVNWYGHSDLQKMDSYLQANKPETNFVMNWLNEDQRLSEFSKKYSPIHYVTETAPPVLTIQGSLDSFNPLDQVVSLHNKLDKANTKNQLLILEGGTHLGFSEEQFQLIFKTIFDFLEVHP